MPRPLGRALVVGASGNVGGAIEEKYGAANVIGTYKNEARTEDGYVYLDIEAVAEDETLAEEIMTMCRPEVVFICAGFNWVDGCENEAEGLRPRNMNAVGPRNLAVAAKKVGAKVVYFSTDAVFIGETAFHTTPFAWCTPLLKDFSRRHSSPALPFQRLTGETFD